MSTFRLLQVIIEVVYFIVCMATKIENLSCEAADSRVELGFIQ